MKCDNCKLLEKRWNNFKQIIIEEIDGDDKLLKIMEGLEKK